MKTPSLLPFAAWLGFFLGLAAPSTRAQSPPTITRQPTNLSLSIGATARFVVAASGLSPLSYQWSIQGSALPDKTNAVLALTNYLAVGAAPISASASRRNPSDSSSGLPSSATRTSLRRANASA